MAVHAMSIHDQIIFYGVLVATAAGYFCAGYSWGMRSNMVAWRRGFDKAVELYKKHGLLS